MANSRKLLIHVDHIWQMEAIRADLAQNEIAVEVLRRPKEYASFISGIGGESYQIFVTNQDYAKARQVISHLLLTEVPVEKYEPKRDYFKRTIALSLMAVMIPVLFNLLATYNYSELHRDEAVSQQQKRIALVVLLASWIFVLIEMVLFWRQNLVFDFSSLL